MNENHQQPGVSGFVTDKWLLSSALQKLIRRGQSVQSIAIALRLHQVDPTYLKRRMPIIAMEDIGIGDIAVCQEVFIVCSSSKWWGTDVTKTISLLSSSMANAVKSRSACDAFCLTEVHPDHSSLLPGLLRSDTATLIRIACDVKRSQLHRLLVLRVLGGITVKENGSYRTLSRCDLPALEAVGAALDIPPTIRWLMARQQKSAGMAAMLPIAFEAAQNAVVLEKQEFPHAMQSLDGIPLCALDQYTQLGKTALRQFYQTSTVLQKFALKHVPRRNPQALINLAMFQAESSLLDRFLSSPKLDELTDTVEEAEMRDLGMVDPANRKELYGLLKSNADHLAPIRMKNLTSAFVASPQMGLAF